MSPRGAVASRRDFTRLPHRPGRDDSCGDGGPRGDDCRPGHFRGGAPQAARAVEMHRRWTKGAGGRLELPGVPHPRRARLDERDLLGQHRDDQAGQPQIAYRPSVRLAGGSRHCSEQGTRLRDRAGPLRQRLPRVVERRTRSKLGGNEPGGLRRLHGGSGRALPPGPQVDRLLRTEPEAELPAAGRWRTPCAAPVRAALGRGLRRHARSTTRRGRDRRQRPSRWPERRVDDCARHVPAQHGASERPPPKTRHVRHQSVHRAASRHGAPTPSGTRRFRRPRLAGPPTRPLLPQSTPTDLHR